MDGHRDCHTEWSKSDREKEISYDIAYMQNLKRNDTNELIYKTETYRPREWTYGYQGGRDSLGVWDWHVHTAIFKMDNQQGPTV